MTGFGGYSEKVSISSSRVFKLPDSITFDQGVPIPVTYGTAYHMLFHLGRISPGDSVLIHHLAGGVGTAVAQLCKVAGASLVIGTASASKKEFVESMGVNFVDRESEDFVKICKEMTGGRGCSSRHRSCWRE